MTNDNVIKNNENLLKQSEETDKNYDQANLSSINNNKKWDKFKSHLKRTFQAEGDAISTSDRPNKLSKLEDSSPMQNNCASEVTDSKRLSGEKVQENENQKSSSSSPSPSPPLISNHNTQKISDVNTSLLPHRHVHPKKAMAAANLSAPATPTKVSLSNNSNNNNGSNNNGSNNILCKDVNSQQKDKKNVPESRPPPAASPMASKNGTKKKPKSKYAKRKISISYHFRNNRVLLFSFVISRLSDGC